MKNKILLMVLLLLAVSNILYAQRPALKVGNNPATINGSAAFEVESTTKGLLPPRMTTAQRDAIANPAKGLIIYDTTLDCVVVNKGTQATPSWECIGGGASSATVVANCTTAGFNAGTYIAGTELVGRTFTVTLTNNTFSTAIITFAASDLILSGLSNMNNLKVGTPTGSPTALTGGQATLTAGQSVTVTYPITGTPGSCGTLQGVWTKLSLNCSKTVIVNPNLICGTGTWSTPVSPNPITNGLVNGLVNGIAYSGTYSIPYTGGGCDIQSEILEQNGLTFSYVGGSLSSTGNLIYTLSGTYTGTTGSTGFTTRYGCGVLIGMPRSCNEIKLAIPAAVSGVYTIDPDGGGTVFGLMQAQCDMTTDGGGWTMIMNYVRSANQTPAPVVRSTLPVVSSGFGGSDVGNTAAFGHTSNALANAIPFSEVRFEGLTTNHTRVMNAKSSTPSVISYIKTGIGNMGGSYVGLAGNTTGTPGCSGENGTNAGNFALTAFTFFCENATQNWFRVYQFETNAYRMDSRSSNGVDNGVIDNTLHRAWVK